MGRQAGGDPLQVHLVVVTAFWFDKNGMALAIGKAHNFIFNGGAVARPLDGTCAVGLRLGQVLANDAVRIEVGIGHPAGRLFFGHGS